MKSPSIEKLNSLNKKRTREMTHCSALGNLMHWEISAVRNTQKLMQSEIAGHGNPWTQILTDLDIGGHRYQQTQILTSMDTDIDMEIDTTGTDSRNTVAV